MPFAELAATEKPESGAVRSLTEMGLKGSAKATLREARHTITRFRITLSVVECVLAPEAFAKLFTTHEIEKLALPAIHAKLVKALW